MGSSSFGLFKSLEMYFCFLSKVAFYFPPQQKYRRVSVFVLGGTIQFFFPDLTLVLFSTEVDFFRRFSLPTEYSI